MILRIMTNDTNKNKYNRRRRRQRRRGRKRKKITTTTIFTASTRKLTRIATRSIAMRKGRSRRRGKRSV